MTLYTQGRALHVKARGARGVRRHRRGRHRDRDARRDAGARAPAWSRRCASPTAPRGIEVGKLGTAAVTHSRTVRDKGMSMHVVTGAAGFIGSKLVAALNRAGITEILAVDNLEQADKFRNLVGCEIEDYLDKREFLARLEAGQFDGADRRGAAPGRLLRHHGDRRPLHDGEQLRATRRRCSTGARTRRCRSSTRRRPRCTARAGRVPRGARVRGAAQRLRLLQVPVRPGRAPAPAGARSAQVVGPALLQRLRPERGAQGAHGLGRVARLPPVQGRRAG